MLGWLASSCIGPGESPLATLTTIPFDADGVVHRSADDWRAACMLREGLRGCGVGIA